MYVVTTPGGRTVKIDAPNSSVAKKLVCKMLEIRQNDPWCGVGAMRAAKCKDGNEDEGGEEETC
jgi:hypothetical protein